MEEFIVFIANIICSIFLSWYLVIRVMYERIYIIFSHTKWEKIIYIIERICQFVFFVVFSFILLSIIPFIAHKFNLKVVSTIIDVVFIFIDFLFVLTSLFYIVNPEFNFEEIKEKGIDKYYEDNKIELDLLGSKGLATIEKRYIEYKANKWSKMKKFPIIRFLREDSRSFIYFVLSTIIAIFCLFL